MHDFDEVEPFPAPVIREIFASNFRMRCVRNNRTNSVEEVITMESGLRLMYELVGKISQTIFGEIVLGIALNTTNEMVGSEQVFDRSNFSVAIKMYYQHLMQLLDKDRTQENPYNEISALQHITDENPNIIGQVECCVDQDGDIYSIMRFCHGGELLNYINERGPFSEIRARDMMRQLLNALQRMQELGVAHRDLSLENILYDEERNLFTIIDFGMCLKCPRTVHSILNPPSIIDASCFSHISKRPPCGKRHYIAPEVLSEAEYFNPLLCDIWALGIILFMVLTGHPLVEFATIASERYRMIAEGRLQEMVEHWGFDFSDEVVDLMQRILRPVPQERISLSQIQQHPWMIASVQGSMEY